MRIASMCLLSSLSILCFLSGCGKSAQPPVEQGKQAASFLSDEQMFAISLKKAEAGDAKEQVFVGLAYQKGEGVPKDTAKAVEWLGKGAVQGDALGQGTLGRMYLYGLGIPKDVAKALDWSKKAAAQGFAPSQYELGEIYKHGEGVQKDDVEAIECYQKAAQQGYVLAQITLGTLYMLGDGVPRNDAKAFEWFQKALFANAVVKHGFRWPRPAIERVSDQQLIRGPWSETIPDNLRGSEWRRH
jgi:TPR repeat protein